MEAVTFKADPPQGAFLVGGRPVVGASRWGLSSEAELDEAADRVWRYTEMLRQRPARAADTVRKGGADGARTREEPVAPEI